MEINHSSHNQPKGNEGNPQNNQALEKQAAMFSQALKKAADRNAEISASEESHKNKFKKKKHHVEDGSEMEDPDSEDKLEKKLEKLKQDIQSSIASEQKRLGL